MKIKKELLSYDDDGIACMLPHNFTVIKKINTKGSSKTLNNEKKRKIFYLKTVPCFHRIHSVVNNTYSKNI